MEKQFNGNIILQNKHLRGCGKVLKAFFNSMTVTILSSSSSSLSSSAGATE
jgi:hypothetical protein